jgi:hypothetical protein
VEEIIDKSVLKFSGELLWELSIEKQLKTSLSQQFAILINLNFDPFESDILGWYLLRNKSFDRQETQVYHSSLSQTTEVHLHPANCWYKSALKQGQCDGTESNPQLASYLLKIKTVSQLIKEGL